MEPRPWVQRYARRRYGPATPPAAGAAWQLLLESVYNSTDLHNDHKRAPLPPRLLPGSCCCPEHASRASVPVRPAHGHALFMSACTRCIAPHPGYPTLVHALLHGHEPGGGLTRARMVRGAAAMCPTRGRPSSGRRACPGA